MINSNYVKSLCLIFLFIATVVSATVYSVVDYDKYDGHQVIQILDDFSGGINSKFPADTIQDNESPDLLNLRINGNSSVSKRPSYSKYNSTAVSESLDSLYRYYEQDGTKNTLVQYDTALVLGNDATGAFTSKSTAITDGQRLSYCTSHNVTYMTDEVDTPLSYYGDTKNAVYEWGCQVPVVTSTTLTQGTSGSLDTLAAYKYKITYLYYGYEESNGSESIDTTLTGSNNKLTFANIPLGDARVTARKIYRTEGGGSVYYYEATISDNTDTTYISTMADTSLTLATICPTDNHTPPLGCQYTFLAANRVFLVDIDNSLYYWSELDMPDIFPTNNYYYVFKDDGEYLKGFAYWKGSIYWFKNTYITATIPVGSPSQWSTPQMIGKIAFPGTVSGWSIQSSPSGIYYLAPNNIYLFTGTYSQPIKEGIEGTVSDINSSYYTKTSSTYWNNTYRLSFVSTSGGGTTPDKQIIWDEFRKSYVLDDKDITCYSIWNGDGDDNQLYAATNAGYVIQEEGSAEEKNPFIHNTKTQVATGTETYVEEGGTEANPTLVLDDDTLPTESIEGTLISAVQSIDAFGIGRIYFNKQVSGSSDAQVYLRTGNTTPVDATWTSWEEIAESGDYPATTSDKDYLQYKAVLTGEFSDFEALNQVNRNYTCIVKHGNDVYAGVWNGDVYKQTNGTGDFVALNQTSRKWSGLASDGTNLYATVYYGYIYKFNSGTGNFEEYYTTTKYWCDITIRSTDIYASDLGSVYKQTGGSGSFVLVNTIVGLAYLVNLTSNGTDVWACIYGAGIWKQTAGAGDFTTLSQTSRLWIDMAVFGNDVYALVKNGSIYKQTAGAGDFTTLSQTSRLWNSITDSGTSVLACVGGENGLETGDIYKQTKTLTNTSLITSDGYFIKVELGSKTAGESTIDFEYKTKEFDLRANGLAPHLKTYTEYIIEYESQNTGTLNFDYWIDGILQPRVSIDLSLKPTRYFGKFEGGAEVDKGRKIQFNFSENSINNFTLKRVTILCEPNVLISE